MSQKALDERRAQARAEKWKAWGAKAAKAPTASQPPQQRPVHETPKLAGHGPYGKR